MCGPRRTRAAHSSKRCGAKKHLRPAARESFLASLVAGIFPTTLCDNPSFAEVGYDQGVPMGGDLFDAPEGAAPKFIVSAKQDAEAAPLQRIQIIKGWIEDGESQVRVYEVAGNPDNGASSTSAPASPKVTAFRISARSGRTRTSSPRSALTTTPASSKIRVAVGRPFNASRPTTTARIPPQTWTSTAVTLRPA